MRDEASDQNEKIALYKFPTDKILKEKWIKAIPRQDSAVTCNSKVCAFHFGANDFIAVSTDKKSNHCYTQTLQQTRLQPTAVPHIFPNFPKYVSKKVLPRSTTASTSSAHQKLKNARIKSCNKNLFAGEEFDTFVIFKNKITSETLPNGYLTLSTCSFILLVTRKTLKMQQSFSLL